MYRQFDIVMVNFFHSPNIIDTLLEEKSVTIKIPDAEYNYGSKTFNNKYVKTRPAIIIQIIKTNHSKVIGYVVIPLTTKFKSYLNKYRPTLILKGVDKVSYMKMDAISTIGIKDPVNYFMQKGKSVNMSNANKKYIKKQYSLFLKLNYANMIDMNVFNNIT